MKAPSGRIAGVLGLLAALCIVSGLADSRKPLIAEEQSAGQEADSESVAPRLFPTNRQLARRLKQAKERLAEEDYSHALPLLQSILEKDEDFFIHSQKAQAAGSLQSEADRLIANLPEAGRESYKLQYGKTAEHLLQKGIASHQLATIAEVARRFFHTDAGYEAAYLLGTYHLERNEPLTAKLHFDRLRGIPAAEQRWEPMLSLKTALCYRRAGMPEKCRSILEQLAREVGTGKIVLGGRQFDWQNAARNPKSWAVTAFGSVPKDVRQEWTVFRGNPERSLVGETSGPAWETGWQFRTIPMAEAAEAGKLHAVANRLHRLREKYQGSRVLTLPATHPLMLNGKVVFRSLGNVKAVDAQSGELLWESAIRDRHFRDLLDDLGGLTNNTAGHQLSALNIFLKQRAWSDLTAGTLSSDGNYVFALEGVGFLPASLARSSGQDNPLSPQDHNKLVAYELETGKAAWMVGGPQGERSLDLAGRFFLGPPLPVDDRLYCLAEFEGEVRLLALKPRPQEGTAERLWSQSLLFAEDTVLRNPVRRQAGVSPSLADGLLVCPTIAGGTVAVDLKNRRLQWRYRYETNRPETQRRRIQILNQMRIRYILKNTDDDGRWLDSSPTIAGNRVVLTPRDSDELHCLNLADGRLQWKKPRDESLYVASIFEDQVILVGRRQVRALGLDEGQVQWERPISMPGGRGYRAGSVYHLPLMKGSVATIDLQNGRILATSESPSGRSPGNLLALDGRVISQTAERIAGYKSFDAMEQQINQQLQADPDNARALGRRGELRLQRGQEEAALADLRRSLELEGDQRRENLLVTALLEGLRYEFSRYRDAVEELAGLIDDSDRKATFRRLYAQGLQEAGQYRAAFRQYLKLVRSVGEQPPMQHVDGALQVETAQWVKMRLRHLYEQASEADRAAIREQLAAEMARMVDKQPLRGLRQFLRYFGSLPPAAEARRQLVDRLDDHQDTFRLHVLLEAMRDSADKKVAAFATARLAALRIRNHRFEQAAGLLKQLTTDYAGTVCLDGKTGAQLVKKWREQEPALSAEMDASPWPERPMQVSRTRRRGGLQRNYPLRWVGSKGIYEGWTLVLDHRRHSLIARDGHGARLWKLSLEGDGPTPQRYGNYVRVKGALMVVVLGDHFLVLDTLSAGPSPQILWKRRLIDQSPETVIKRGLGLQQLAVPGGRRKFVVTDPLGRRLGRVVPLAEDLVCYQQGTRLIAADPVQQRILWQRYNVPRGSAIFGDHRHVFVTPPNSTTTRVLRAGDGVRLRTTSLPKPQQRILAAGRHVLHRQDGSDRSRLAFRNAFNGNVVWQREFTPEAEMALIEGTEVAVLEPEGKFLLLNVRDGAARIETQLQADQKLDGLAVLRSRRHYVVLTNRNDNQAAVPQRSPAQPVNGYAYGFNRNTGRRLWTTEIENQGFTAGQPENLPVLVLAVRQSQPRARGGVFRNHTNLSIGLLDKRTGRIVTEHKERGSVNRFRFHAEPANDRIHINFYRSTMVVTFPEGKTLQRKESSP